MPPKNFCFDEESITFCLMYVNTKLSQNIKKQMFCIKNWLMFVRFNAIIANRNQEGGT